MHTFDYIAIGVLIVLGLLGARWLFLAATYRPTMGTHTDFFANWE
jgi:hypothetical protein